MRRKGEPRLRACQEVKAEQRSIPNERMQCSSPASRNIRHEQPIGQMKAAYDLSRSQSIDRLNSKHS